MSFREQCTQTRTRTERGPLRFLSPPSQAASTRCEQFDRLTLWGESLLAYHDRGDFAQVNPRHVWDAAAAYKLRECAELEALLEPLVDRVFADRTTFTAAATDALGPEHAEHLPEIVRAAELGRREFRERFGWVESFRSELTEIYVPLVRLGYAAEKQVKAEGLHGASRAKRCVMSHVSTTSGCSAWNSRRPFKRSEP